MNNDNDTLKAVLAEMKEICEDAMGEWIGIAPPYLPSRLDAIHEVLELIYAVEVQL